MQEVSFAIALQHSENSELRELAVKHLQKQLPELINNYLVSSETTTNSSSNNSEEGLHDSSPEVLHLILLQVFDEANQIALPPEAKDKFLKNLRRDFPRELVPVVLAPVLYPEDPEILHSPAELTMTSQMVIFLTIT